MKKQEIYSYLKEKKIWHEITEHKAELLSDHGKRG